MKQSETGSCDLKYIRDKGSNWGLFNGPVTIPRSTIAIKQVIAFYNGLNPLSMEEADRVNADVSAAISFHNSIQTTH